MAATGSSNEDVKVVLIDTQYVETDPVSFKSVVQRLTGKDCNIAWIMESSFSCRKTETKVAVKGAAEGTCGSGAMGVGYGGAGGGLGVSMLTKGSSFKDLDRMILEAPPVDELKWLWTNYLEI
ncbi:VQ motif-containing protein 10-like [Durio zibethinus]|uniref:VQ motif-containing protein 10-like n=1 Tax=Durio zibethinus TaxID=66656 RepID=A0A6P6BJP0_DURZI|nr:VQ motif-containing protein 10-like [Durio zibethinus]